MQEYMGRIYNALDAVLNAIGQFSDEVIHDFSVELTPRCTLYYERPLFVSDITTGWFWFEFKYRNAGDLIYLGDPYDKLDKWICQALNDYVDQAILDYYDDCDDDEETGITEIDVEWILEDLLDGFEQQMDKILHDFGERDQAVCLQPIPPLDDILSEMRYLGVQAQLRCPDFKPWSKPVTDVHDLAELVLHAIRLVSREEPTMVVYHGAVVLYLPETRNFHCGAVMHSTHPFYEERGHSTEDLDGYQINDHIGYVVEFTTYRTNDTYKVDLTTYHPRGQLLASQGPRFLEGMLRRLVCGEFTDYAHGTSDPGFEVGLGCDFDYEDINVLVYDELQQPPLPF